MKLLALETATDCCSVALFDDGEVREDFRPAARRQTELILPMVEALLAEAGWTMAALDGIAFGRGPGAFTGVRVAVSVTQGLAWSRGLGVVGVSTLEAGALDAVVRGASGPVFSALDARLGEIYLGVYEALEDQAMHCHLADCLCPPDRLPELPPGIRFAGGSAEVHADRLAGALPGVEWLGECRARAGHVATLAAPRFAAGEAVGAEQALPVYLRDQVIQGAGR